MRILQVNDAFGVGGAETYMKNLGRALEKKGHSVHYFAFGKNDVKKTNTMIVKEPANRISRQYYKFAFYKKGYEELKRFIKKTRPDVIHLHNINKYPLAVLKAVDESKIPVVQTVHDFGLVCPNLYAATKEKYEECTKGVTLKSVFAGCTPWYAYIPLKILYYGKNNLLRKMVKKFITPSRLLKKTLEENGFRRCVLLHHFVKENVFQTKDNKLIFVGALNPNKGADVLIKAISRIDPKIDAEAEIVGDGSERKRLEKLATELNVRKKVRFLGGLNDSETAKKISQANILVFPSIALENSPMTIYEGMASKTLVIASDIGGIPDLVEDKKTGLLFRPNDELGLAEKINYALRKNTRNITENALKKAKKEYNEDGHIRRIVEIYSEVKNEKKK